MRLCKPALILAVVLTAGACRWRAPAPGVGCRGAVGDGTEQEEHRSPSGYERVPVTVLHGQMRKTSIQKER